MNATNMRVELPKGLSILGELRPGDERVLTREALDFVARLEREFDCQRRELLLKRQEVQDRIDQGTDPIFPTDRPEVRRGDWRVAPIPADLQDRRVEITGPVERKMMINALNSGAKVFMADFEDANSPTWRNVVEGQLNLMDAVAGTLELTSEGGKHYRLRDEGLATLVVRPRGWHLEDKHLLVDGRTVSGSLMDFGLYFFHNAKALLAKGSGPYFYLPKLENADEARLWNDVFLRAQSWLDIPLKSIKATVLIETVLAAFEMEEILFELKDHMAALNAGRWDYIFSVIKKFRNRKGFVLPDRDQIGMTVPFMRAYTERMVQVCHQRGAHAIGGMAAFIPSRRDEQINALAFAKVREDKERESADGFDGTWVAHPDLVPVAKEVFDRVLGDKPHQKHRLREEVRISERDLVDVRIEGGVVSEVGVRKNIHVALRYLASWLEGVGAVAIFNLMEDAATAEISRSQLWQWLHNEQVRLDDGRTFDLELFRTWTAEELAAIAEESGSGAEPPASLAQAADLLDGLVASERFEDFLTWSAYEILQG